MRKHTPRVLNYIEIQYFNIKNIQNSILST